MAALAFASAAGIATANRPPSSGSSPEVADAGPDAIVAIKQVAAVHFATLPAVLTAA